MQWFCFPVLVVALSVAGGCLTSPKEGNSKDRALIERARVKVWASGVELSQSEREAVKSQRPEMGVYRLAGDYAQYYFVWLADGVRIVVSGQGRLSELEGAEVKKIKVAEKVDKNIWNTSGKED